MSLARLHRRLSRGAQRLVPLAMVAICLSLPLLHAFTHVLEHQAEDRQRGEPVNWPWAHFEPGEPAEEECQVCLLLASPAVASTPLPCVAQRFESVELAPRPLFRTVGVPADAAPRGPPSC
jgi:hypothetical protein